MQIVNNFGPLVARIFIGVLFVLAGAGKFGDLAGTAGNIASGGLPGFLAAPAAIFEVAVGLAVIAGFQTRIAALAGAAFCVVTAVLYHNNFADQMQMVMFLKNFAIAGGFLLLAANGAGKYAVDK